MSIHDIRLRAEGKMVVLQVAEDDAANFLTYEARTPKWRDAKMEDMLEIARRWRLIPASTQQLAPEGPHFFQDKNP